MTLNRYDDDGQAHAQAAVRGNHERPQVQGVLGRLRHPGPVLAHELLEGGDERLVRQLGHRDAGRRGAEPGGVRGRPEQHHRARPLPVGLQALEDLLGVVEHRGGGVQGQRAVGLEPAVMPAALRRPPQGDHVVGEDLAETGCREQFRALRRGDCPAGRVNVVGDLGAGASRHLGPSVPRAPRRCAARLRVQANQPPGGDVRTGHRRCPDPLAAPGAPAGQGPVAGLLVRPRSGRRPWPPWLRSRR